MQKVTRQIVVFTLTLLAISGSSVEAQDIDLFLQGRPALVQDSVGAVIFRYTGLEALSVGRVEFSSFHINSEPFSVWELTAGYRFSLGEELSVAPGPVYIANKFGDRMAGVNLAVSALGGVLTIPLARYLRSVTDESGNQWAIIANFNWRGFRSTAQAFNRIWEAQIGWALPGFMRVSPDLRLLRNRNGWGTEIRLNRSF